MTEKNNDQDKENKESERQTTVFPHFEPLSFAAFLQKIGVGLVLSFLPAYAYSLVWGSKLSAAWGIALIIVAGIYFLIGGCSDLTQTSARKSLDRYLENVDRTQKRDEKFQYSVGMFQFGKNYENIAAAICLFAISFLISGIPI
jgi:hypothetical protein